MMYNAKRRAIGQKNFEKYKIPYNFNAEDLEAFTVDENVNEFYMWHYAPNIDEIKSGVPLKRPIDLNW